MANLILTLCGFQFCFPSRGIDCKENMFLFLHFTAFLFLGFSHGFISTRTPLASQTIAPSGLGEVDGCRFCFLWRPPKKLFVRCLHSLFGSCNKISRTHTLTHTHSFLHRHTHTHSHMYLHRDKFTKFIFTHKQFNANGDIKVFSLNSPRHKTIARQLPNCWGNVTVARGHDVTI